MMRRRCFIFSEDAGLEESRERNEGGGGGEVLKEEEKVESFSPSPSSGSRKTKRERARAGFVAVAAFPSNVICDHSNASTVHLRASTNQKRRSEHVYGQRSRMSVSRGARRAAEDSARWSRERERAELAIEGMPAPSSLARALPRARATPQRFSPHAELGCDVVHVSPGQKRRRTGSPKGGGRAKRLTTCQKKKEVLRRVKGKKKKGDPENPSIFFLTSSRRRAAATAASRKKELDLDLPPFLPFLDPKAARSPSSAAWSSTSPTTSSCVAFKPPRHQWLRGSAPRPSRTPSSGAASGRAQHPARRNSAPEELERRPRGLSSIRGLLSMSLLLVVHEEEEEREKGGQG